MQIDAEHIRVKLGEILFDVEVLLVKHHRRQVIDARAESVALEVFT